MECHNKNLDRPDETLRFDKIVQELVELGDFTVGRYTCEPGWRWSTHIKPRVGGEWCQARHVGIVMSGRLGLSFPDGSTKVFGPKEVYDVPPGHDGYTVGEEPVVSVEWVGSRAFAGNRAGAGRVLATLMFTDLVGSTETAAKLGDVAWRALLSSHFEATRAQIHHHRGLEVKTAGDGFLATFDGPAQALACASGVCGVARRQGLSVRAGVHVGEVERVGADVRGIAVHEAARIMAQAPAGGVLVSEMTRSLAQASGFAFDDRGTHVLKGLAGEWRLYALIAEPDRLANTVT